MVAAVAEVEAPKKKLTGRVAEIPLLIKMKARNLYLTEGLGWTEIGERCGYGGTALAQLAHREGWTAEKKRRASLLLKKADARIDAMQGQVIEAIAARSEQAALQAMDNVDSALRRSDEFAAKDFQAYTAGVKNLASTARMLREPVSPSGETPASLNLNFFFAGSPNSEPKKAEVIDVPKVTEKVT